MTAPSDVWSALTPIGLDDLNGRAALETRLDRKYVVPPYVAEELIARIGSELQVLEIDGLRSFEYETVYFDTEDFDSYLAAARSRPTRFKVRTRTYLDSAVSVLEVKMRDRRQRTVKYRLPYAFHQRDALTPAGEHFIDDLVALQDKRLRPVLVSRYARRTVLLPTAGIRATIDSGYRCRELDEGHRAVLPAAVIVETKSTGKPGPLDHLLWRAGYRPTRISKYCTGLAVARGGLPANKWHRTIVRHMAVSDNSEPPPSYASGPSQTGAMRSGLRDGSEPLPGIQ
jgi:hypothetical protein